MDKKQLIWVLLLSFLVIVVLQRFLGPRQAPRDGQATDLALPAKDDGWGYGGTRLAPERVDDDTVSAVTLGALAPDPETNPYRFQLTLDPRGASVRYARLAGYYYTVEQKRTPDKTPAQLQQWSYAVVSPAKTDDRTVLPFSTSDLLIKDATDGDEAIPTRRIHTEMSPRLGLLPSDDTDGAERELYYFGWKVIDRTVRADGTQVARFRLNLYRGGADEPAYTLIKTYEVPPESYSFRMTLEVRNHSGAARNLAVVQNGPTGIPLEGVRGDQREVVVGSYVAEKQQVRLPEKGKVPRAESLDWTRPRRIGTEAEGPDDRVLWAGVGNKFFASLMYPVPDEIDPDNLAADVTPQTLAMLADPHAFYAETIGTGEEASQLVLLTSAFDRVDHQPRPADPAAAGADGTLTFSIDVFVGPKEGEILEATTLHAMLGYHNAITFQSCQWCLVEPLAEGAMWLIAAGGALLHNYGVMIILLVLVIRLALHPITKRSQVGMMKMRKLQPQMQAIQEKHKDDKEAQQKAMMEFMRQTGFSPFLGCLPMLLQMPIWIALWAGLNASVVLRHEGLLPFWITNLAGPDTVLKLAEPFDIPLLGRMMGPITGLNILPILLAVFMFLQQKLMPMQAPAAGASQDQQRQQKMMMYFMSGFMLLIFYNAPSGLTLYIMASTAYGVIESYVIRRHIREREEQEAAAEVRVTAPGKRPRGTRPKKPKDRFRG
ncbi:MAG: membrane protein insertase YidC [Planctomycetota bacterium]